MSLDFHSFVKKLWQIKSFCVFTGSAFLQGTPCCTNIVLLWCGANTGKYHFTRNKWSKDSRCVWMCHQHCCFVVVQYVYRKKGKKCSVVLYLDGKSCTCYTNCKRWALQRLRANNIIKDLHREVMWQFVAGMHSVFRVIPVNLVVMWRSVMIIFIHQLNSYLLCWDFCI